MIPYQRVIRQSARSEFWILDFWIFSSFAFFAAKHHWQLLIGIGNTFTLAAIPYFTANLRPDVLCPTAG